MFKKTCFILIFTVISFAIQGQDKEARGFVTNIHQNEFIDSAAISVVSNDVVTYSDRYGSFSVVVPKKHRHLTVSKEGYKTVKIRLTPGFQHRLINVKLSPFVEHTDSNKSMTGIPNDSRVETYKNVLSLSLLELFNAAISVRYERFIKPRHSFGLHVSNYLYGRNIISMGSEHDYYAYYSGIKPSIFYRFYAYRRGWFGIFADAKIHSGYFHFYKITYRYGSNHYPNKDISYDTWLVGGGLAAGVMLKLSKRRVMNISIGYQYFPIDLPETTELKVDDETTLTLTTDDYWWYWGGPGSYVEIKLTIGGIF